MSRSFWLDHLCRGALPWASPATSDWSSSTAPGDQPSSFQRLHPRKYDEIKKLVAQQRAEREHYVSEAGEFLSSELSKVGIEADISGLGINESLKVNDLHVPSTLTVLTSPDEVIVSVVPPQVLRALEELEAAEAYIAVTNQTRTEERKMMRLKSPLRSLLATCSLTAEEKSKQLVNLGLQ